MSSLWTRLTKSWGLLGRLMEYENTQRKFGANPTYVLVQVEDEEGVEEVLMFTHHQIDVARERASKNPEDVERFMEENALSDLLD